MGERSVTHRLPTRRRRARASPRPGRPTARRSSSAHGFPELALLVAAPDPGPGRGRVPRRSPPTSGATATRRSRPTIDDYDIVHLTDDLLGLLDDARAREGACSSATTGARWWCGALAQRRARAGRRRRRHERAVRPPGRPRRPPRRCATSSGTPSSTCSTSRSPGWPTPTWPPTPSAPCGACSPGLVASGPGRRSTRRPCSPTTGGASSTGCRKPDELPDWLTEDELDHYVAEFRRTGFTGGINWYRNLDRNWELMPSPMPARRSQPPGPVHRRRPRPGADDDPARRPGRLAGRRPRHASSSTSAGHWVQQEKPAEVNATLLEFLDGLTPW